MDLVHWRIDAETVYCQRIDSRRSTGGQEISGDPASRKYCLHDTMKTADNTMHLVARALSYMYYKSSSDRSASDGFS